MYILVFGWPRAFPGSTARVAGPVRRVTCTKTSLFLISRHPCIDRIPTIKNSVGCTITHDSPYFLICDFATATPELLRVIAKRRVPFSRRNNGEDVGKGFVQDVNHKDDPADYSRLNKKWDPSRRTVTPS